MGVPLSNREKFYAKLTFYCDNFRYFNPNFAVVQQKKPASNSANIIDSQNVVFSGAAPITPPSINTETRTSLNFIPTLANNSSPP